MPGVRLTPRQEPADRQRLALIRQGELAHAAALLGVTHVYQLGYHDSGMAGWASNQERQAFVQVPLEDVTGRLVPLIRRHRPDVVVTYDAHGGYGHPDHIMAHRVTMASVTAAAVADRFPKGGTPWQVRKVYYVVWPQSVVRRAMQVMRVLEPLRAAGVSVLMHSGGGGMKSQFKKADASGARHALVFGADEVAQGMVALKPLRDAGSAQSLRPLADAAAWAHELRTA